MNDIAPEPVLVIITGPPGAGKTTSVELLKRRGLVTMPEVAREMIEEEQRCGGDVYPWTRLTEFVERLWRAQERQFCEARRATGPVFFDRGIPDALAFLSYHGAAAPDAYVEACHVCHYDLVFDLMMLPNYECDVQRPYSQAEAIRVGCLNQHAYQALAYDTVLIPTMPPEERVDLILRETQQRARGRRGSLLAAGESGRNQAVAGPDVGKGLNERRDT